MLALVNWGTFDSATGGTFQSDTGGTFHSDIPGTFESDMGGTFKVLQSHRDEVTEVHLHALGWHVITIWECELQGAASVTSRLDALAEEIHKAGVALLERKALYKSNRLEAQRKAREMKERQVLLEAEIDALYPIPKKVKMESRSEI